MCRVLLISNNCFNTSGSNGRVMYELFSEFSSDQLHQFYISPGVPDLDFCSSYYYFSDKDALLSLFHCRNRGTVITKKKAKDSEMIQKKNEPNQLSIKKSAFTYLVRDVVWQLSHWGSKQFWAWVDDFKPDVVYYQAGDSSFMPQIALKIAKRNNIPIVIYNTENYYFKDYNYFFGTRGSISYYLFHNRMRESFKKIIEYSSLEFYNSEYLEEMFEKEFGKKGEVIYQASSLIGEEVISGAEIKDSFLYAGNLGLHRHKSLIQLAKALSNISTSYIVDVYGSADDQVISELRQVDNIRYHGLVPYAELVDIMKKTEYLIHVETFEDDYVKDLVTAFTTKIADILALGKCMIMFAPESLACTKYLIDNDCAFVLKNDGDLSKQLSSFFNDSALKERYKRNGIVAASKNNDAKKNSKKLIGLIESVVATTQGDNLFLTLEN